MAFTTVEGYYEGGRVELAEHPDGVERARVMVTFLTEDAEQAEDPREALRQRLMARLQRGVNLSTEPFPTREELYAERLAKF